MHTSAFGVEHWESQEIHKAQSHNERAEGYRKTKNTLAGVGGVAAGLGAATGAISAAEYKGKDPVGLSLSGEPGNSRKYSPASKKKFLRINAKAHGRQTAAAAGISAASLGLAGAYRHAEKKERLKNLGSSSNFGKADTKRKVRDAATDTGTAALGAGAVGAGAYNTKFLGPAAKEWGNYSRYAHGALKGEKKGKWRLDAKQRKYYKKARVSAARTAGIKGAGVAASVGVAGLGAKAVYDVGSRNIKEHK